MLNHSFERRCKNFCKSSSILGTILILIIRIQLIYNNRFSRIGFYVVSTVCRKAGNISRCFGRIRNFRGRFKLDFTEDYLNKISVDRLRHILLAALINAKTHN